MRLSFSSDAPFGVGEGREQRTVELAGLKAELMLETAGVAVVRSEFGTASQVRCPFPFLSLCPPP